MPNIYLIAGCNGAGKTTASMTLLPEMLDCNEFVNADNIAAGISPLQPEKASFEAGRLMLQRIDRLVKSKVDFAIETTLSSKNYISKVEYWQHLGYDIVTIYFWLNNPDLAIERIQERVKKGGHFIPNKTVIRRYYRGIKNLFDYFLKRSNYWLVIDNSKEIPDILAEGIRDIDHEIFNKDTWELLKGIYNEK